MPEPIQPATTCARPPAPLPASMPPLTPPIQLSSVYEFADLERVDALYEGREPGYVYARDGHPNGSQLASKVSALEGGEAAIVCASGMAAESALMLALLGQGDRVAMAEGIYGRTAVLVGKELARFGVGHDLFDASDPRSLRGALKPETRLVFAETISNPLLRGGGHRRDGGDHARGGGGPGDRPHLRPPALPAPGARGRRGDPLGDEGDRRAQRRDARPAGRLARADRPGRADRLRPSA